MESDYLIERYAELRDAAERNAHVGWRSPREDGQKRRFAMTPEVLDRFADYVFGGIGFETQNDFFGAWPSTEGEIRLRPVPTEDQRNRHRQYLAEMLVWLQKGFSAAGLPPEAWLPLITADNVVGGLLLSLSIHDRQILVSSHTLRVAERSVRMRQMLGSAPSSIIEIGGGHGRFVRDVLKLWPDTRITYCDLPFNMLLAGRYLSKVFPGDVHLAWDDTPIPDTARITIVPPWRLADIPYPIDVCCNFLSFQHMTRENLAYYGAALHQLNVTSIYHCNRETALHEGEIPLDDYPFRNVYETVRRRLYNTATFDTTTNGIKQPPLQVNQFEELLRLKA